MSTKHSIIWDADAHTIAKIQILKSYLQAWLRILGSRRKDEVILYVDGFAGPGRYRNHEEGSPLGALRVAFATIQALGPRFIAKQLHGAFFERDADRFEVLCESVAPFEKNPSLGITKLRCEFTEGIGRLRKEFPAAFSGSAPLFVFADPFGGTGIPFSTFAACMEGQGAELLINLDADGIGRIFLAKNENSDEQLTELFGDESWRNALSGTRDLKRLSVEILDLYKKRLLSLPGVHYVWSFAMRGARDVINYHLVFATRHPLGLEKMKEAMRAIDQTGSFSFSDAHSDQIVLFREDNEEKYAEALFQKFEGQCVPAGVVDEFALTETPFVNAKKMLIFLEKQDRVKVEMCPGEVRRAGTFPDAKVQSLRFGRFGTTVVQADLFQ